MALVELKALRHEVNGQLLFEMPTLFIHEGDIIGVIGRNGAGKSTLLRLIQKQLQQAKYVKYWHVAPTATQPYSMGENVMYEFVRMIHDDYSLYLLDEPTSYLDSDNRLNMINVLLKSRKTFCIATHDRALLHQVCTKIWLVDNHQVVEYQGNYAQHLAQRELQQREYESDVQHYIQETKRMKRNVQKMKERQQKQQHSHKKMSNSERRLPGMKTMMNTSQQKMQQKISQQTSKLQQLDKPQRLSEDYDIAFLAHVKNGATRTLFVPQYTMMVDNAVRWELPSMTFYSGERVFVKGHNGSGKTTWLNYIQSHIPSHYRVGYFKQDVDIFGERTRNVLTEVSERLPHLSSKELRNMLALLNFKGESVHRPLHNLSSGEKVKLQFLCLVCQPLDVLLLDELTNFLDLMSIEAVEKILLHYSGILVMVSHDDVFIERLATKVIELPS